MNVMKKRIGEILLEAGQITKAQLDEALKIQVSSNNRLGEIFVEKGILTQQQVTEALGLQFMLPVVDVNDYLSNVAAVNSLPKPLMERLGVFPLELQNDGNTLLVAISDPLNLPAQDELGMVTPLNIKLALATEHNIYAALAALTQGTETFSMPQKTEAVPVVSLKAPPEEPATPAAAVTEPLLEAASASHGHVAPPPSVTPLPSLDSLGLGGHAASSESAPAPETPSAIPSAQGSAIAEETRQPDRDVAPQLPVEQAPEPAVAQEKTLAPSAAPTPPAHPAVHTTTHITELTSPVSQVRAASPSLFSMMKSQPKLGDILVQAGVIKEAQLVDALKKQKYTGKRLGEILFTEGIITEVKLAEALSTQLKLPMFTLTRYRPMPEAIKSVPRHVSERLQLIPLSIVEGDLLLIAMANPLDLLAQDEVRMLTGRDLKIGITTATEINGNLDRLYNLQGNLEDAIVEIYGDNEMPTENVSEAKADDAPVIQLVSNVLDQAVREGASDIHVEPYEKSARIRYRVDGGLYTAFDYPVALHPAVSARLKIMAGMDIAEKRKPQDGRILIKVAGRRIDLRVSSLPTMNGEKMVLRILDQESSAVGLDRLGMEADDLEKIDIFCGTPWGIMLVTGPTGSGKSTTLYSILEKINQPDVNIITVEDPVEFTVSGINQVHVNEKAGLTFESALRSILRQDPDKVMVGEIRDQKTAQIAIRAALTGHFVLSTLHTNDAPSAATRMVDMGVAPFLVSASLAGVIAQRLVRKLCPFCKEKYEMNPNMCDALEVPHGTEAWKAIGCNECRMGYKGRKGIYEIMMVDDDMRKMILEGVSNIQLRAEAIKRGMKTLRQSGINNALAGLTSIEEVFVTTI